jgi:hypothetical protein
MSVGGTGARRPRGHRVVAVLLAGLVAGRMGAQPARPPATVVLDGRVLTPHLAAHRHDEPHVHDDSTDLEPVVAAWVTLHRVARGGGAPVDSVRTDTRGAYRLRLPAASDDSTAWFAATTVGGIVYFTAPLRPDRLQPGDGDLTVFDTTSVRFPLAVRGRHVIVRAPDAAGRRTIIEVLELSNDSARTLIAADRPDALPTFSLGLPAAARDVRPGDGDVPAEAIAVTGGRLMVSAAIAPGVKQLAFSYVVDAAAGPVTVGLEQPTSVLEVLLEEPGATVEGARLVGVGDVTVEGRRFRRFLAQDARAGDRVALAFATAAPPALLWWIVGGGALTLLVLIRTWLRRAPRPPDAVAPSLAGADLPEDAQALARAIADLDAHFARVDAPTTAMHEAYARRRADLTAALARRSIG